MIYTTHPLYDEMIEKWLKIQNVTRMTSLAQHLIRLNPQDESVENETRNAQYRQRAIFYAISAQTSQGMVGSIFRKWPTINIPDALEYLKTNADGAGNSIYQCSQSSSDDVLRKGRGGILVTFPQTDGNVSRADMQDGRIVASIKRFTAEDIINWRVEPDGARMRLTLVVTREFVDSADESGYGVERIEIFRESFMDYARDESGFVVDDRRTIYRERIWVKGSDDNYQYEEYTPLDSAGQLWEFIPFTFIGAENNDATPDFPPLLPIVELNIGHYRNSADYEDSVWFCGQAQPWMSGITQDHIDMMNENKQYVGSRNLVGVPSGEQFGFAQASPNTMVKEAMDAKVEAMVQLGARLMQFGSATKTAEQAGGEREAQTSVLAMVASNVSEAYTQALKWCARYMGASDADLEYTLSQEFVNLKAAPQEIQQIVAGFLQGVVPVGDYTRYMRRNGFFSDDVSDEDYEGLLQRPAQEGF